MGFALVLTSALFLLVPASWLQGPGQDSRAVSGKEHPTRHWLVLSPPPVIAIDREPVPLPEPEKTRQPVPEPDPRWWSEGWRVRTEVEVVKDLAPASVDSVAVVLNSLGVGQDLLQQSRPDSVLASRLLLMQVEDSFLLGELKPYLSAMARSRAYADIMSRAADMYDEHLQSTIMTPD